MPLPAQPGSSSCSSLRFNQLHQLHRTRLNLTNCGRFRGDAVRCPKTNCPACFVGTAGVHPAATGWRWLLSAVRAHTYFAILRFEPPVSYLNILRICFSFSIKRISSRSPPPPLYFHDTVIYYWYSLVLLTHSFPFSCFLRRHAACLVVGHGHDPEACRSL